ACPGGSFIGASIVFDLDQTPHRCFYAPPPGGNAVMRVRFADVAFASVIHGHVGLAYENERDRTGANVVTTFRANGRQVGRVVHVDGDGWKGFELSTSDLQGQKGELVVEIQSAASGRQFCFEADTR